MSVQSWYDRDVSDVAGLLAEEHVARTLLKEADLASSLRDIGGQFQGLANDAGKRFSEFSQNFGPQAQEFGGKAMEWLNDPNHQAIRHGLVGAGVGGLLGAGSQIFRDPEDRQYGSSAMTGALAGGALGGGLGLMRQNMSNLVPDGATGGGSPAAAGEGPPQAGAAQAGGDNIEQQIAELNNKIQEATQGQTDAINKQMSSGIQRGLLAAPASSAAFTAIDNRPGATILRGAKDLGESDIGSAGTSSALKNMKAPLTSKSLNWAGLQSYIDPKMPSYVSRFEDVPDADNPLSQMLEGAGRHGRAAPTGRPAGPAWRSLDENGLGHLAREGAEGPRVGTTATNAAAGMEMPAVSRQMRGQWEPGQFFAKLDAPNAQIPELTNAQVRDLMRRGRRWPTRANLGVSAGLGLLPMALAALGSYNVGNAQDQLANTMTGGQN